MGRRSKVFQELTSEFNKRFLKKEDKKVLKVYHDLKTSIPKCRGDKRIFFWSQVDNLVTRLCVERRRSREKDKELEELEEQAEEDLKNERVRRRRLESELDKKKREVSDYQRTLEEKERRIKELEHKLASAYELKKM